MLVDEALAMLSDETPGRGPSMPKSVADDLEDAFSPALRALLEKRSLAATYPPVYPGGEATL